MTIRRLYSQIYALMGLLLAIVVGLAVATLLTQQALVERYKNQYESWVLADELRQSSDDLTRFARTYVATGDPRYEAAYWNVIAIRDGRAPRPRGYERIYWDLAFGRGEGFRGFGETRDLRQRLLDAGVTAPELQKLREAQKNSDDLVNKIERMAMNAVKGIYEDGPGSFVRREPDPAWAQRLLNDERYHEAKMRIMQPIDEFYDMLGARTQSAVDAANRTVTLLFTGLLIALGVLMAFVAWAFFAMRSKITAPLLRLCAEINSNVRLHEFTEAVTEEERGEMRELTQAINSLMGMFNMQREALRLELDEKERRAMELSEATARAEAADRSKVAFLASMSHELRTPLNAILGYATLLKWNMKLTSVQVRALATIERSGQHLLELINDILDLARIETHRLELSAEPVDLEAFLQGIVEIIRVRAEERGLALVYEGSPLRYAVVVDEKALRQVLLNLLGNAVKFTDRGTVTLRAGVRPEGESALHLHVEVQDTGIGIRSQDVADLFQRFHQLGDIQTRRGGTGLGLAISQQLVQLMGGEIRVRTEWGKGSTFDFEVRLPLAESDGSVRALQPVVTGLEGSAKTVLVADDIVENRTMLVDLLNVLGFVAYEASDGRQAIEKAQALRPDVILMDCIMPVMSGLEAIRRLRTLQGFDRMPVIAISASASKTDVNSALAAGATAFLSKPVNPQSLLELLERHLDIRVTYDERKHV